MVKFILGEKGSGKTKWLIDNANEEMKNGNGNVIFVDVEDDHIYSLDYNVRLINATKYKIHSLEALYGFLCGILAMDYDIEKVYVDSIYKIFKLTTGELEELDKMLEEISKEYEVEFFLNVNYTLNDVPESFKAKSIELKNN